METLLTEKAAPLCDGTPPSIDSELYLFVCTGNTCRSPMAAAVFNHLYATDARRASSAGLCANGAPLSENAARALEEAGITPPEHVSRTVNEELLKKAVKVFGITRSHADSLIWAYPEYASKITVLPADISDPYGGGMDVYRNCLAHIRAALETQFGGGQL